MATRKPMPDASLAEMSNPRPVPELIFPFTSKVYVLPGLGEVSFVILTSRPLYRPF